MLDGGVWLLLVLLLMALIFAILGMLVGLVCALVTTATKLFAYAGTNLWESLEDYCERVNRPRLLALVSLVAKVQTPDSERALQLDYVHRKKALVAEASALVQHRSVQRNQLTQESHTVSVELRKNWQKIKVLSDEYLKGGTGVSSAGRLL
ncbi:hypothetical protein BO82DRAFT_399611 [Aspergillus uvarum CBS 121591]|uniref:Uncharacterized protein n=1 Tax=Aspergillus uvarum CBS 121591 TaxID=1448315 RepID=A0A319CMS3_9EURO|nr:hypothetical protein BO82DRAFT_399611 [Aspergillus uvarum CBS 121591]PYH84367.1 hypothetical protein BO82DRAFT_399611 [Aspergillus uvarum CBS 121591]